jgi:hypothetical protein
MQTRLRDLGEYAGDELEDIEGLAVGTHRECGRPTRRK